MKKNVVANESDIQENRQDERQVGLQSELDACLALVAKNPDHITIVGGNKFYTKHYIKKLRELLKVKNKP
ncbi:MAG: hypothetical protein AAB877_00075 [Patescibacteria group bacterium]